ncbi:uncharacterized protein LOC123547133 [Mercenaria mercenaria]|uniref:uncharacterized protein LOC123547133 n=1 Tax=Mercenaria mercenaria TaxID=6596 RepID=UPI00234FA828|nr:uncharacterized protein LOC123547133 [Mercenaria mercenaria]XP_053405640.1 uncharacterized protein LOC123547133 [Mercenaria mercenaria]XP_053405641.1 uncharacterized protein LOC123547133 [Mercenaria mercenaria]XP_053405642.1 uncharacterized protein LOC123547133 [Mercenaria mercenaria]
MAMADPGVVDYSISYITTWGDEIEKKDGELTISLQMGLIFSGHVEKQINIESLRWISKQQYTGFPERPQHCLVVSYLDADSKSVSNVFFELKLNREEIVTKCLDNMKDLLTVKYQGCTDDLEKISDVVALVFNQPIFMGRVNMTVVSADDGKLEAAIEASVGQISEYLMLIDLECMCLYRGELTKPVHQLMFWEEESASSIERVKLTQKPASGSLPEKTVFFQTKTQSFAYSADAETVKQIQNLIPKKKNLMTDPKLMLEIMPRLQYAPVLPTKHFNRKPVSPPSYPSEGAVGGFPDFESMPDGQIAERLAGQLATAELTFQGNDDMQNIWIAIEFDIKEIMDSGVVPTTDHRSGGMSAESGDHLEKALQDLRTSYVRISKT